MSPILVAGACALGRYVPPVISRDLMSSFSGQSLSPNTFGLRLANARAHRGVEQLESDSMRSRELALLDASEVKSVTASLSGIGPAHVCVNADGDVDVVIGDGSLRIPVSLSTRMLAKSLFLHGLNGGLSSQGVVRFGVSL